MDQIKLGFTPLFFHRTMKAIQDHECSLCGDLIPKGSSYFHSMDLDPLTGRFLKYCEGCFDVILERPSPKAVEKMLDLLSDTLII